jgi:hypothetical protein
MRHLNDLTGEFVWRPQYGLPEDPDPQHVKDEGLDCVVWKAVENRPGKLFLLAQCACGDDYAAKLHDIDSGFSKLSKWFDVMTWAFPLRVFCTPRHIPNDSYFGQLNREAGLTLDRSRIVLLAEAEDSRDYIIEQAREPYADLIRLVIPGFQAAPPARGRPRRKAAAGRRSQSPGTVAARNQRRKRRDSGNPAMRHTRGN